MDKVSKLGVVQDAIDHMIFAMSDLAEIRRDGPIVFAEGSGTRLTGIDGKKYVDMIGSTTRANSLGYGREDIAKAFYEQSVRMHYAGSAMFTAEPTIQLAKTLASLAPGGLTRSFFVSGGSEAVESALKIAKQSQQMSGQKPRAYKIISRWNAYHGSTMGALSVTDWLSIAGVPDPRVPGMSFIPSPSCYRNPFELSDENFAELCAEYLERQILLEGPEHVAAFIAEPIMQANGVQIAPRSYWDRIREICDKYGVLLIIDEVICGFGRTGKWFGSEHFGIKPDIITVAKAMTAGYAPMGAALTRDDIAEPIPHFRHIHTFSGHASCAAVANKVIAIKKEGGLIEKAYENGARTLQRLKEKVEPLPIVGQVRGLGHWHAIDFTSDKTTKAVFQDDTVRAVRLRLREMGILVGMVGSAIELAPPLVATRTEIDDAVDACAEAIQHVAQDRGLG